MRNKGMVALLTLALLAVLWCVPNRSGVAATQTLAATGAGAVVIDAGHGGEDGGAVSINGVPESGINLAIALKLEDVLAFCGTPPTMLRREDISLHDASASTLREKKVSDLHNRAAALDGLPGATLISIHQNSYPQSRYHGAQVFYAPTQGSKELADHVQETLRVAVEPVNKRLAKQIPDTVYLMNHITCRAILVECGFLTNAEEEAKLLDPVYQTKLAAAIASAYLTSDPNGAAPAI